MTIDNEKIDDVFKKVSKYHYSSITTFNQHEKDILNFMERLKIVIIDKDKAPEDTWVTLDVFGYKVLKNGGWQNYLLNKDFKYYFNKIFPLLCTIIGAILTYLLRK